jgi:hypothetical protein
MTHFHPALCGIASPVPQASFDPVFQYFWAIAIGFVAINVAIGYRRAGALVAQGQITARERTTFSLWVIGGFTVLFGLQGLAQAIDGASTITCLFAFPPRTLGGTLSWAVTLITNGAFLLWLWCGRGADFLSRIGPAYLRGPADRRFNPRTVRLALSALLIIGPIWGMAFQHLMPPIAGFCPR